MSIWIRHERPESGNPWYNNPKKPKSAPKGYSDCTGGKPAVDGLNVLCNCVGLAWGAFYETWYHNDIESYKAAGGFSKRVHADGGYIYSECKKHKVFGKYCLKVTDKPPKGGLIIWKRPNSSGHVAYISDVSEDGNRITIHQSSYGGASWENSSIDGKSGAWDTRDIKRNNKGENLWWYQNTVYKGAKCVGFVANPGVVIKESTDEPDEPPDEPDEPIETHNYIRVGELKGLPYICDDDNYKLCTPNVYKGKEWVQTIEE